MGYKVYASEDYVKDTTVAINQGINNAGKIIGIDENGKVKPLNYLNGIIFKDATTGIDYIGYIDNGEWTLEKKINRIEVTSLPDRTNYIKGEELDFTGLTVIGIFGDNTSVEITDYIYDYDKNVNGDVKIIISYEQIGVVYTTSFEISIISLDDFVYTDNNDGTYTITDWKGTYNGEPSEKYIVPNSKNVIIYLD